ncbi:MAG TPA: hypothetical protein VLS89_13520, partial [Candidatus Nanopelagicales bacterium]|nr:hypothetical protein [Candidatus Nanopelagicales bacterium]
TEGGAVKEGGAQAFAPGVFPTVPESAQTLDSLRDALGAPDEALRRRIFRHVTEEQLTRDGVQIDSISVIEDAPRFVASALTIIARLEPGRRQNLLLPPGVFAVFVDEALRLRQMKRDHNATARAGATDKADREATLRREMREGIALRDVALGGIRAALSEGQFRKAEKLAGDAASSERLGAGLNALGDFLDGISAEGDAEDLAALKEWGLEGMGARLRARAEGVIAAGKAAAQPARRVSQRSLDIQDGRVLLLVGQVLRAFKLAQRADRALLLPELNKVAWFFASSSGGSKGEPGGEGPAAGGDEAPEGEGEVD